MDAFLTAASYALLLAYLAVASTYAFLFLRGSALARRLATPALRLTLAFHLAYLVALTWRWQQLPAATVDQALSVLAFAIAAVYAFLEWLGKERATGLWMLAQVVAFQLLAVALQRGEPPRRELFQNPLFSVHVSLALLGYASFAVAASYGFLFLKLYRELKRGRFSVFFGKLPPLEVLERMMAGALVVGTTALTLAVFDGVFWAQRLGYEGWVTDPKIALTLVIWLLYAVALLMRRLQQWHGRQTAVASLAGLGVVLFSMLAVNLLFSDFHDFQGR